MFQNGKIGFVDIYNNTQIQPNYVWREHSTVYGFSEGLSCVIEHQIPIARRFNDVYSIDYIDKIGFIDSRGDLVISTGLFCSRSYGFYYPYFSQDRVIVEQCEQVDVQEYWVRESYNAEIMNRFLRESSPGMILDRRLYDENGSKEEFLVRLPVFRSSYVLIDKKGEVQNSILSKKGYNAPLFYPFSQGLSIIVWIAKRSDCCSNLIEVIDREGNLVITYDNLPEFRNIYSRMPAVFLGETAYIEVVRPHSFLKLSLDGRATSLKPERVLVSDNLQRAEMDVYYKH